MTIGKMYTKLPTDVPAGWFTNKLDIKINLSDIIIVIIVVIIIIFIINDAAHILDYS